MTAPTSLASLFPRFTEADWRAAIARTRRAGSIGAVADSGAAGPLFARRTDARPVVGRAGGQPWVVVARTDATTASLTETIAGDLAGGSTGAELAAAGSLHPLGGQLRPEEIAPALAALGDRVPARFHLRLAADDPATIPPLLDIAKERGADVVIGFDPIAALAVRGSLDVDAAGIRLTELTQDFDARDLTGAVAIADGRLWHAGGATDEQELSATLASFVGHLRLADVSGRIDIALAADADQYRTIAKFRAMRLLLARVAEVAALEGRAPRIHAETAWRSMSRRNPEINILRATSGAFAAAAGGADSITVLPFDAIGGGDDHGRRLARNTSTILAEEANLFRVADPGAGAGAIEAMTAALAEAAWKRFQAIEAEGGIIAAIGGGTLMRDIAEAREARIARVIARQTTMVGVNAYAGDDAAPTLLQKTRRMPIRDTERLVFKRVAESFERPAA